MSCPTRYGFTTPPPSQDPQPPTPAPERGHGGDHQIGDAGLLIYLLADQGALGHPGLLGLRADEGLLGSFLGFGRHGDPAGVDAQMALDATDWDHLR